MLHKVYVLVTWDDDMPLVRSYEDEQDAAESYRYATEIRAAAFLYVTDESGRMDLILETERMPPGAR